MPLGLSHIKHRTCLRFLCDGDESFSLLLNLSPSRFVQFSVEPAQLHGFPLFKKVVHAFGCLLLWQPKAWAIGGDSHKRPVVHPRGPFLTVPR